MVLKNICKKRVWERWKGEREEGGRKGGREAGVVCMYLTNLILI